MPTAAPKPCARPGCGALVRDGRYCERHRADARTYDRHRGSAAARGYGRRWRKARQTFLARNPFCTTVDPDGCTRIATIVDHIEPHRGDDKLFWDTTNWQPLCKHCHDVKTAREDGAFGRPVGGGPSRG